MRGSWLDFFVTLFSKYSWLQNLKLPKIWPNYHNDTYEICFSTKKKSRFFKNIFEKNILFQYIIFPSNVAVASSKCSWSRNLRLPKIWPNYHNDTCEICFSTQKLARSSIKPSKVTLNYIIVPFLSVKINFLGKK